MKVAHLRDYRRPDCPHCGGDMQLPTIAISRARIYGTATAPTGCCGLLVSIEPFHGLDVQPLDQDRNYLNPNKPSVSSPEGPPCEPAGYFQHVGNLIQAIARAWPEVAKEQLQAITKAREEGAKEQSESKGAEREH